MKTQHAVKWAEFEEAKIAWGGLACQTRLQECDNFFLQNHGKRSSSVKGHFPHGSGRSAGALLGSNTTQRQEYVFIIKKGIVDDIIGDMFYCPPKFCWLEAMHSQWMKMISTFMEMRTSQQQMNVVIE
ncbi:hypothetical protein MHU86_2094 [Fragilaria crotonensis]|nr:hypothetical protein MHU86_2094 [Fragilaria crotonensis]